MNRGRDDHAPAANGNGNSRYVPGEAMQLSPRIRDLILRFTLLDGGPFDLAALARGPLPLPAP
jgi:hypothetical protein